MHTLDAYLGPAADDLDDEAKDRLEAIFADLGARYPAGDEIDEWADERLDATNAAAMIVLGDATLAEIAGDWQAAVRAERLRMAALTGALVAEIAHGDQSERGVEQALGLNRQTIRKALGKGK